MKNQNQISRARRSAGAIPVHQRDGKESKKSSAKPGSNRREWVHIYVREQNGRIITHGWWEQALVDFIKACGAKWRCDKSEALSRLLGEYMGLQKNQKPQPALIPVIPCSTYYVRETAKLARRKTIRREEILHELGSCIDANSGDSGPIVDWQNRCLTKAIELLGGKVVVA